MIYYLEGTIQYKTPEYPSGGIGLVILNTGGIGYGVYVSLRTYALLPEKQEQQSLYIYTQQKEDGTELFGFPNMDERQLFTQLLSVPGIGGKVALRILSTLDPVTLVKTIMNNDSLSLTRVNGLGKKGAEKITFTLKDKFAKYYEGWQYESTEEMDIPQDVYTLAVDSLKRFEFSESEARTSVRNLLKKHPHFTVEQVIKEALRQSIPS